jgi:hypothetical protein
MEMHRKMEVVEGKSHSDDADDEGSVIEGRDRSLVRKRLVGELRKSDPTPRGACEKIL